MTTPENSIFSEYWKNEGFVNKLVSKKGDSFDLPKNIENLTKIVVTKSFENDKVYKDSDARRMSNFTSSVYYRLHFVILRYLKDYNMAKTYLEKAVKLSYGNFKKRNSAQLKELIGIIESQEKERSK